VVQLACSAVARAEPTLGHRNLARLILRYVNPKVDPIIATENCYQCNYGGWNKAHLIFFGFPQNVSVTQQTLS
jgi:hypothetical protein